MSDGNQVEKEAYEKAEREDQTWTDRTGGYSADMTLLQHYAGLFGQGIVEAIATAKKEEWDRFVCVGEAVADRAVDLAEALVAELARREAEASK